MTFHGLAPEHHRILSYGMDYAKERGWFVANATNSVYWERYKAKGAA